MTPSQAMTVDRYEYDDAPADVGRDVKVSVIDVSGRASERVQAELDAVNAELAREVVEVPFVVPTEPVELRACFAPRCVREDLLTRETICAACGCATVVVGVGADVTADAMLDARRSVMVNR